MGVFTGVVAGFAARVVTGSGARSVTGLVTLLGVETVGCRVGAVASAGGLDGETSAIVVVGAGLVVAAGVEASVARTGAGRSRRAVAVAELSADRVPTSHVPTPAVRSAAIIAAQDKGRSTLPPPARRRWPAAATAGSDCAAAAVRNVAKVSRVRTSSTRHCGQRIRCSRTSRRSAAGRLPLSSQGRASVVRSQAESGVEEVVTQGCLLRVCRRRPDFVTALPADGMGEDQAAPAA
jgi:hypothetical protein